jgi:sugar fermentation stimulation protein A
MPPYGREIGALPEAGGAYGLLLRCDVKLRVRVGALGVVALRPGFYCYVGSARGGLRARLARHLRSRGKRTHWHVDYVRRRTQPAGVLVWAGQAADECALSEAVAALADGSVKGFGCSDCRCASHLHYFRCDPAGRLGGVSGTRWVALGRKA